MKQMKDIKGEKIEYESKKEEIRRRQPRIEAIEQKQREKQRKKRMDDNESHILCFIFRYVYMYGCVSYLNI